MTTPDDEIVERLANALKDYLEIDHRSLGKEAALLLSMVEATGLRVSLADAPAEVAAYQSLPSGLDEYVSWGESHNTRLLCEQTAQAIRSLQAALTAKEPSAMTRRVTDERAAELAKLWSEPSPGPIQLMTIQDVRNLLADREDDAKRIAELEAALSNAGNIIVAAPLEQPTNSFLNRQNRCLEKIGELLCDTRWRFKQAPEPRLSAEIEREECAKILDDLIEEWKRKTDQSTQLVISVLSKALKAIRARAALTPHNASEKQS